MVARVYQSVQTRVFMDTVFGQTRVNVKWVLVEKTVQNFVNLACGDQIAAARVLARMEPRVIQCLVTARVLLDTTGHSVTPGAITETMASIVLRNVDAKTEEFVTMCLEPVSVTRVGEEHYVMNHAHKASMDPTVPTRVNARTMARVILWTAPVRVLQAGRAPCALIPVPLAATEPRVAGSVNVTMEPDVTT